MRPALRAAIAPLVVFVLALGLRVAYVDQSTQRIGLDSDKLTQLDTYVFAQWARVIADGDLLCWRQPHAFHLWTEDVAPESKWLEWYGGERTYHQAPLYAYFVAASYWAFGRAPETLGYVQAVLGALACALTLVLARRLVSPLAGWIAGLLLAFMGQYYFYDAFTLRDGPLALLTVSMALTLDTAVRRGKARDWMVAGAVLGLFALAKETGLPLFVLLLAGLLWAWRREPRRVLRAAALLLAGFALVTTPAFVRNVVTGCPTFKLSTRGPEVVVVGNAQGQDGVGWDVPTDTMRGILMDANFSLPRTALLTLATHRADPWGFVRLQWNKTTAFWNDYEEPNNANFYLHRAHLETLKVGVVNYGLVSALALLGLLLGLPRKRELAVVYGLLLALVASVIALYVLGRFRVHVLPLMAFFAGLAVDWFWRGLRTHRTVGLALALVPLALLLSWTASTGPDNLFYKDDKSKNTSMMMLLLKSGNYAGAVTFYDRLRAAIAAPKHDGPLTYIPAEGTTEARLASIDDAFVHFRESTRWSGDRPERHVELGRGFASLLGVAERYEHSEVTSLAREQFELALRADADTPGAHRGLASVYSRNKLWGEAYGELNAELDAHPDDAEAHRDLGMLQLFRFEKVVLAQQHFLLAEALGLDDDARMLACMAGIEVNTQLSGSPPVRAQGRALPLVDPERGAAHARRALELLPDDPIVMEQAATALYATGDYDRAVQLLTRLIVQLPWRKEELEGRIEGYRKVQARKQAALPGADGSGKPP